MRVRGGSLYSLGIPRVNAGPAVGAALPAPRHPLRRGAARLADASVEAARAAFFPSITLTGQGGFTSTALRLPFRPESAFYSLAAGLTQPIFDGFLLEGQLELAQGRQIELLNLYRKAVVSGFTDVETGAHFGRRTPPSGSGSSSRWWMPRGAPLRLPTPVCGRAPWTS